MTSDPFVEKWNQRHEAADGPGRPAQVLLRNLHLLPEVGVALDLACGRGANALLLAEQGLETHAWDFSSVAIERLQQMAVDKRLQVETQVRDVVAHPPPEDAFDVILVSGFLERKLIPHLIQALRPGGRLYYQTFVRDTYLGRGPRTSEWRLENSELLRLFEKLDVLYYREEGAALRVPSEIADLALLVAMKRN